MCVRLVYDVFIAPVYAATLTVGTLLLYLAGIFLTGYLSHTICVQIFTDLLHLDGELSSIGDSASTAMTRFNLSNFSLRFHSRFT